MLRLLLQAIGDFVRNVEMKLRHICYGNPKVKIAFPAAIATTCLPLLV